MHKNKLLSFYIGAYISFLFGVYSFFMAKSAIHEIEGCISFVVSAILFSTINIVKSINALSIKAKDKK